MAREVEEDSGIDGRRLRMLARELSRLPTRARWWPFDDPFAIALSAILTQRARWSGAQAAVEGLRREGLLTPTALACAPLPQVERLLRPAGFYRQKARAVRGLAVTLVDRFDGRIERVFLLPTPDLRRELLSWPGVGEETADAILLFAAGRPAFVVDAYTLRLMRRFGALDPTARPSYGAVSLAWVAASGPGAARARRLHAAIVDLCKATCRPAPLCTRCPLRAPCPKAGVVPPAA